jgi:hypothetical protein
MGSVHARGDTFLTFGLKALTETNTSRLATVPQVIYEYGETRWNDIDRGKLQIRPSELSMAILLSRYLVANQEDLGEENDEFCLRNISFIHVDFFKVP